jgi:uncharacterized protein YndB with AHSA1/START domain
MQTTEKTVITIEATVKAPIEKVWKYWSEPQHITQWAFATEEWHAPAAENDLRTGGKFSTTMAAKDGSFSFEFAGEYDKVETHKTINYTIGDGRKVQTSFQSSGNETKVVQSFEAEDQNSIDMQRGGWQAILNNFKRHVEDN